MIPTPHILQELLTSTALGLSSLAYAYPSSGKQYWEYKFQHQPSREECEGGSLSAVFEHFVLLQRDISDDIFELLFWGRTSGMEWGQVLFLPQEGWDPQGRGRAGLAKGDVIVELSIKSCLLWPDFASVDLCGEACLHLNPTPWTLPTTAKGMGSRKGCS